MRTWPSPLQAIIAACLLLAFKAEANATEYAFSTYGLGGVAFGAGVTPPAGTYVTAVTGFYSGKIGGCSRFRPCRNQRGSQGRGFHERGEPALRARTKLFGGNLGLSVTVPVGHVDIDATLAAGPSREVDGWGLGDIVSKAQLGWQRGDFSHTV